jgi:hypothetical protein
MMRRRRRSLLQPLKELMVSSRMKMPLMLPLLTKRLSSRSVRRLTSNRLSLSSNRAKKARALRVASEITAATLRTRELRSKTSPTP